MICPAVYAKCMILLSGCDRVNLETRPDASLFVQPDRSGKSAVAILDRLRAGGEAATGLHRNPFDAEPVGAWIDPRALPEFPRRTFG